MNILQYCDKVMVQLTKALEQPHVTTAKIVSSGITVSVHSPKKWKAKFDGDNEVC